jgi:hypothetical protein
MQNFQDLRSLSNVIIKYVSRYYLQQITQRILGCLHRNKCKLIFLFILYLHIHQVKIVNLRGCVSNNHSNHTCM